MKILLRYNLYGNWCAYHKGKKIMDGMSEVQVRDQILKLYPNCQIGYVKVK